MSVSRTGLQLLEFRGRERSQACLQKYGEKEAKIQAHEWIFFPSISWGRPTRPVWTDQGFRGALCAEGKGNDTVEEFKQAWSTHH